MNNYQLELYNNLMTLVTTNEAFYMKDQELDGVVYRVFSYRLASYTDFCLPGALECRGIMFKLASNGDVESLVSMPMNKFFNWKENPFTENLDFTNPMQVMLKADGSLISSYLHNGKLRLKSKTSLSSMHCVNAMHWLSLRSDLYDIIMQLDLHGYTVNMEYTSPEPYMRIVIGYQEPRLTILNVRDRSTGEYVDKKDVWTQYPLLKDYWIDIFEHDDMDVFVNGIDKEVGIEGYVIQLSTGQLVKIKTEWYRVLHHTKDSVNNPRRLFEAVLEETTDDLRAMFQDDPVSIKSIEEMEIHVSKIYNHLSSVVDKFYQYNHMLDRPSYAIKGQAELNKHEFGLAMNKYLGKVVDVKGLMIKRYRDFGIKDERVEVEE